MQRFAAGCDRLVVAGILFLIFFTPLAVGGVHPWAYRLAGVVIFALVLVWMTKRLVAGPPGEGEPAMPARLWLPMCGFFALVTIQIVPLPPAALRVLSPSTYAVYERALPGWPERPPFADLIERVLESDQAGTASLASAHRPVVLPAVADVERFGHASLVPARALRSGRLDPREREALEASRDHGSWSAWRPISLAPGRTWSALLEMLAYVALFFVVTAYPVGVHPRAEARFQRTILWGLVLAASLIAIQALVQRLSWNGKILWFFVPWDWGEARPDLPQTSGPFVNRNHLAGYLAALAPLVLVAALVPAAFGRWRERSTTRGWLLAGLGAVGLAIVWSLSRGGWLAALGGLAVLAGALGSRRASLDLDLPRPSARKLLVLAGGTVALGALVLLVPMPNAAPGNDIDVRLQQTLKSASSWDSRVETWRDTLPMVRDFPILGVGLGAWRALFPRYDVSFWTGTRPWRAHNDYLQLLAETGLVGALLAACVVAVVGMSLLRALHASRGQRRAILAAIAAGIAALALHELVDFDLQIPAVAVVLAILLGLGVRGSWERQHVPATTDCVRAGVGAVFATGLLALCLMPSGALDPARAPADVPAALAEAVAFPPASGPRVDLAARVLPFAPAEARRTLEVAVELDPRSPAAWDTLAAAALASDDPQAALRSVEESVYAAPDRKAHPYLASAAARWLSDDESAAIERGFERAIPAVGARAVVALADLHVARGRKNEAGRAWLRAAELVDTPHASAELLARAGADLAAADEIDAAEQALVRAIELDPEVSQARVLLISRVYGGRGDLDAAREAADEGVRAGLDPVDMQLALAEAARRAQDGAVEQQALEEVVQLDPEDARAHYQLGLLHGREGRGQPAAEAFREAVTLDPERAEAWFQLGRTTERLYRFAEAREAFERAHALQPESAVYRDTVRRFEDRLARGG